MLLFLLIGGCGHAAPPVKVEAPNWLWWGRGPEGAKVSYPEEAWSAGIEGDTAVEACVDRKGRIEKVRALSGPAPLAEASTRAVGTWSFEPVVQEGRAVPACFQRKFQFRKQPEAELFFRTDGETIVTRGYEPPLPEYRPPPPPFQGKGNVYVRLCMEADGAMRDVTVLEGPSAELNQHVAESLRVWRFRSAKLRGQAIPSCLVQRVRM